MEPPARSIVKLTASVAEAAMPPLELMRTASAEPPSVRRRATSVFTPGGATPTSTVASGSPAPTTYSTASSSYAIMPGKETTSLDSLSTCSIVSRQPQPPNCGGRASKSSNEAGSYSSGNAVGAPGPTNTQAYRLVPTRKEIMETSSSDASIQSTELV